MGSCISKCRPKKKLKEDDHSSHVQDKLVISQNPPIPTIMTKMPLEKPLSPAPSTPSFSSFSSSTIAKPSSSISSSSSLSSSSSVLSVKDRSFSNEFLWSCIKENPHIVTEKGHEKNVVSANKIHFHNPDRSPLLPTPKCKHYVQEKATIQTPKKRARASSPTLVRQKSFRKEQSCVSSTPSRGLRSPSPSRRFESNRSFSTNGAYEHSYKRPVVSAVSSGMSFRDMASNNRNVSVRKKEGVSEHVSRKMDVHVGGGGIIKSGQEMDVVMEDIDNPLIALDCFIFL